MKSILLILNRFTQTVFRFPVAVLSGVLAFIFLLLEIHGKTSTTGLINDFRFVKLFLECSSAISLFIAFDILCESQQFSRTIRWGLYLLGFSILGLHYYSISPGMFDSESIFVSRYLIFIACFHLLVSFVAFNNSEQLIAFWQYNYHLFTGIVTSLLYSLTLFAGLASAMWAIDQLFTIRFNPDYYTDLFAFILLVFNTIFFLNGMPTSYQAFNHQREFRKPIRVFVQYVLLPIVAIYLAILYLYLIKIITEQQLPNGWVCIPILIFSIIGILAFLLIYPIRLDKRFPIIFYFAQYFFYLLLPLLSLYFIAIMQRILPYGITEDRYLVFILGVWIAILSIYIIFSIKDNIIIVPLSLFILLAVSAIGPWGMFQLSVQNQVMRLEHLLKRNHLLENGKLVEGNKTSKVDRNDAQSIRSIFAYLNKRDEISTIYPWLDEETRAKMDSAVRNNNQIYVSSVFPDLGPESPPPFEVHRYFLAPENHLDQHAINVGGYQFISRFNASNLDAVSPEPSNDSAYSTFLKGDTLSIQLRGQPNVRIAIREKLLSLIHWVKTSDTSSNASGNTLRLIDETNLQINVPGDSMKIHSGNYKLLLQSMEFFQTDTSYQLIRVEGLILY